MYGKIQQHLQNELNTIEQNGIFKKERIITSPQGAEITVNGETVLNFCANNYLGLSSHPEVIQAAKDALDSHGFGMSSVRFICGTQDIHKTLEQKIADFVPLTEHEQSVVESEQGFERVAEAAASKNVDYKQTGEPLAFMLVHFEN